MTIEEQLKQIIQEHFDPSHFELVNESHKHAGHVGDDGSGQTHFKLMVVSDTFEGCSRVQRHRMVYDHLDSLFSGGLHALSLKLLSSAEYKKEK